MRILLDECLPKRLARHFPRHEAATVSGEGLRGLTNGRLLDAIQDRFDVFVTIDSNLEFQQRIQGRPILVVVVKAATNRMDDLIPLVDEIDSALSLGQPGTVVYIGKAPF